MNSLEQPSLHGGWGGGIGCKSHWVASGWVDASSAEQRARTRGTATTRMHAGAPLDGGVVAPAVVALAHRLALEKVADCVDHTLQGLGGHGPWAAGPHACAQGWCVCVWVGGGCWCGLVGGWTRVREVGRARGCGRGERAPGEARAPRRSQPHHTPHARHRPAPPRAPRPLRRCAEPPTRQLSSLPPPASSTRSLPAGEGERVREVSGGAHGRGGMPPLRVPPMPLPPCRPPTATHPPTRCPPRTPHPRHPCTPCCLAFSLVPTTRPIASTSRPCDSSSRRRRYRSTSPPAMRSLKQWRHVMRMSL